MGSAGCERIGIVVHPRRDLRGALATLEDVDVGRTASSSCRCSAPGDGPEVAPAGRAEACDVVLALGGDGTTLAALHAAAPVGRPVMGVACGSLGALTAVGADRLEAALDALRRRGLDAVAAARRWWSNGGERG